MFTSRAAAAAATLATLGVLATTAPAQAERLRHHDAVGDLVGPGLTTMPPGGGADITRTVMRHTPNRVIVRTHYLDLPQDDGHAYYMIETPSTEFDVFQTISRQGGSQPVMIVDRDPENRDFHDAMVECEGVRQGVHYDRDRLRISIPRSCLGDPATVRMRAEIYVQSQTMPQHHDNALKDGWYDSDADWGWSRWLRPGKVPDAG